MYKRFDHFSFPLHVQLDPSIVEIAHTTCQIKLCGSSCRKRAKPYSLHTTTHEDTHSNRRFINRLSHLGFTKIFECKQPLMSLFSGYSHTSSDASRVLQFCAKPCP